MLDSDPKAAHRVVWKDVFDGRAELHLSPESMLHLAKLAGAPWNDHDPDADLSPVQKEIVTTPERVVIVFGGSRGGKSIAGAVIALAQLVIPNSMIALVGANYEHCAKEFSYIWKGFFRLFPKSACRNASNITKAPHFNMSMETIWGSHLQVFSTQTNEGRQLLGNEFDLAVLCEAAQISAEVYNVKLERALMGRAKQKTGQDYLRRTGRAILLTTPAATGGASYDIYQRAVARTKGRVESLRIQNGASWFDSMYFGQFSVIEMNPTYPKEAFEAARKTLPRHAFEEQFLGKAILRSGLVYSSFNEVMHVIPREKLPNKETLQKSRFGVGLDTGQNFAAILVCMTPDGTLYVIGETYTIGNTVTQDWAAMQEMLDERLGDIFPDPINAAHLWCVDVNSQQVLDYEETMEKDLYRQKYDLLDSLGHLDMRMGKQKVFIADDLYYLLTEIRGYRWSIKSKTKDMPVGTDHAMDAFRYIAMPMFEEGAPAGEPAIMTVQEMLDQERDEMLTPNLNRDLEARERARAMSVIGGVW